MFILIDGDHLFSRSYHALSDYTGINGEPAGGVYGFVRSIRVICRTFVPSFLSICWGDRRDNLWRRSVVESYKAHRPPTPSDFIQQVRITQELMFAAGMSQVLCPTFEADDVIAALTFDFSDKSKKQIGIITGDHDLFQLVRDTPPKVRVFVPNSGDYKQIGEKQVEEKFGIPPKLLPMYMALKGEKGDGVPGVPGIGKVRAKSFLLGKGSPSIVEKIRENQDLIDNNLRLVNLRDTRTEHLTPSILPILPKDFESIKVLSALRKIGLTGAKTLLPTIREAVLLYSTAKARGSNTMEELLEVV